MRLPIFRQLSYISYSTYAKWKRCQYKVYLTKQAGLPYVEQPSNMAAQIGTAFDAFIKEWIHRNRKMDPSPLIHLDTMLQGICAEAIEIGKNLTRKYVKCKLATKFLDDGDLYLDQELYRVSGGIPILGRLDAIRNGIPFDWKTKGMISAKPATPTKGADNKWTWYEDGNNSRWHDNICRDETPLEIANPDWAEQFCFYNWLLGNGDLPYHVHEYAMTSDGLVISELIGNISSDFEERLRNDVERMWDELTGNLYTSQVNAPSPSKMLCEMYGQVCEAAHHCKYYMDSLGNVERRDHYV